MFSSWSETQRLKRPVEGFIPNPNQPLQEQCREVMRFRRFSFRTEQTYWDWIKRFILFHGKRHPREMGESEVTAFLTHLDADGFAHAQAAMINEGQTDPQPRLAHDLENPLDILAREHDGQLERLTDLQLLEDGPALNPVAIDEEGAQGIPGGFHGAVGVELDLAQEQEVLADLVLGEGDRIALKMVGSAAHVTDVFLAGGRPVIFEFDKLLELRDGRVVRYHRWERMPSGEDKTAHHFKTQPCTTNRSTSPAAQRLASIEPSRHYGTHQMSRMRKRSIHTSGRMSSLRLSTCSHFPASSSDICSFADAYHGCAAGAEAASKGCGGCLVACVAISAILYIIGMFMPDAQMSESFKAGEYVGQLDGIMGYKGGRRKASDEDLDAAARRATSNVEFATSEGRDDWIRGYKVGYGLGWDKGKQ